MFFFSPGQGLVEHILVISHGIMVGKLYENKEVMLDEKMGKVAEEKKKKKKKEKKKYSFMFLRFYVERA